MATQKEIVSVLDYCSRRAEMIGATPATSKQCWFLAGLIAKSADENFDSEFHTSKVLTSREASRWIDFYLNHQEAR